MSDTEQIDRLFLELSQFTKAKTAREIWLEDRVRHLESYANRDVLHVYARDILCMRCGEKMRFISEALPGASTIFPSLLKVKPCGCAGPTIEGVKRLEPDGIYDGAPCTCRPQCDDPCEGGCGCEACHLSYGDYLSSRVD